jgi:hypothetical protein
MHLGQLHGCPCGGHGQADTDYAGGDVAPANARAQTVPERRAQRSELRMKCGKYEEIAVHDEMTPLAATLPAHPCGCPLATLGPPD